jgi:serine/threonine protein kinase
MSGTTSLHPAPAAQRRVGRFELRSMLGRGAQATVWLAQDTRLDRPVALKLLQPRADALAMTQCLEEARAVSRLTHPHVVPLFEADEAEGHAYLVFEHVAGQTLAQACQRRSGWQPREAVVLLQGVLGALAAAHAQGIVHRDLKPSNILIGKDGRARVMDFGIAARVPVAGQAPARGQAAAPRAVVGTPGYISPEAARGMAPTPAMDVFSFGLVLAELLCGSPLLAGRDTQQALHDVQQVDLGLPGSLLLDERLRAIVARALARDPAQRFDSAAALQAALAAWLDPSNSAQAESAEGHGTLDFLLRRMRHKSDFPALSESVLRIQRVAESDSESVASLSDAILRDVSLTHKLLRMVNTVHFAQSSSGGVSTVTRAVALVGFAAIRNMALSVLLMDHMSNKAHAQQLKEEFLRALMAGTVASELAHPGREAEDAYLASMFQNLGRLLTEYYFPEEAQQVRMQLPPGTVPVTEREAAARSVLGLDFDSLGQSVARSWGLPDKLLKAMRAPQDLPPLRAVAAGAERLRWLGSTANALTDALLLADGTAQREALAQAAGLHAGALGMDAEDVLQAAQVSRGRLSQWARVLGLKVAADAPAQRIMAPEEQSTTDADAPAATAGTAATEPAAVPAAAPVSACAATMTLASDVQTLTDAVSAGEMRLPEVLQAVLQLVHGALGARCAVMCLRDARSGCLTGRLSQGAEAQALAATFRIDLGPAGGDLFSALCLRGADMLIADAGTPQVQSRLPAWFKRSCTAGSFLLLPMVFKGAAIGLIYADKAQPGGLVASDEDMRLLRSLRDQAVAAFNRSAAG